MLLSSVVHKLQRKIAILSSSWRWRNGDVTNFFILRHFLGRNQKNRAVRLPNNEEKNLAEPSEREERFQELVHNNRIGSQIGHEMHL